MVLFSCRGGLRVALILVKTIAMGAALAGASRAAMAAETDIAPATLRDAKPGTIFRVWPLGGGALNGNKGYRVLYRSTDYNDAPVAVTGAIIFPATPATKPRDVVAWAHPTTGVVSRCAPTLIPDLAGTIMGIDGLTDAGYVVVATDYVGLGTKDHHPYLVGASAARSVLDSVRAAQQLKDVGAGHRFAVWGHSQGGHAALFTGIDAARYAPELKLVGVAAAAPATNLIALFKADRDTSSGRSLTAMTVLSWSRVFGVPMQEIVKEPSIRHFEALASDCIETIRDFGKESHDEKALERSFLKVDPVSFGPVTKIMEQNTPGALPAGTPVFIAQGTADDLVRPAITKAYVSMLCRGGARVKVRMMQGVGHMWAGRDSADAAVQWLGERFRGSAAPSDCSAFP
ncbi:alpha/beta fold hydrolase [uncultured Hyphomicrobium sp.]|uniref:lipase family protein n=1 Tax=uncultured Hyphomicrobium sp. TaxID=194373 RepID=UPI0025CE6F2C|nr:alpha/beta fold hydrolase [uncultured Hyphomicrobium sp.]